MGGRLTNFSKAEFNEFLVWIRRLKKLTVTLNPQMSVLNVNNGWTKRNDASINAAISAYRSGMSEFLSEVSRIRRPLSHKTISTFVFELQAFSNWKNSGDGTKNVADFLTSLKTLIVGEVNGHEEFDAVEWKEFARVSPIWFSLWLRFHYQVKHADFFRSADYETLAVWLKDMLDQVERSLSSTALNGRPRGTIRLDALKNFVETLGRFGVLPENIRYESINALLQPLIQKIFGDFSKPVRERTEINITRSTLREMRLEYHRWLKIQDFLSVNLKKSNKGPIDRISDFLQSLSGSASKTVSLKNLSREALFDLASNPINKLYEIVEDQIPLFVPGDPRTVVSTEKYRKSIGLGHSYYQLSLLNLFRVGVRFVIRGYNVKHSNAVDMLGVKEEELSLFINEFRSIFEDLNLLPRDQVNPGQLIALQANLFTYASNGIPEKGSKQTPGEKLIDGLVDFNEGLYLFSYMLSSWAINSEVYPRLFEQCKNQLAVDSKGEFRKDVFGKYLFKSECFHNNIMTAIGDSISNLPHLREQLSGGVPWLAKESGEASVTGYRDLMMDIAGEEPHMGYIHIGKIVMVSHFIETLITNYDGSIQGTEPDQIIDGEEAGKALDTVFKGLLRKQIISQCVEGKLDGLNRCEVSASEMKRYEKSCAKTATDGNIRKVFITITQRYRIPTSKWNTCWFSCLGTSTKLSRFKSYRVFSQIMNAISPKKKTKGAGTEQLTCEAN